MLRKIRRNYKRLTAFFLSAAMIVTNIGGNAGAVLAAERPEERQEERESSIFMVDGQEILDAVQDTKSQEAFSKEELEELGLSAGRKGIVKKYEKLLMPEEGKVYELALDIDTELALEGTALQVYYNEKTKEVIFLYLNESGQAVDCYVNIDGYETKLVTVEANDANVSAETEASAPEEGDGKAPGESGADGSNGGSGNGGGSGSSGGAGGGSSEASETSDGSTGTSSEESDSESEDSGKPTEEGSKEEAPSTDQAGEEGTEGNSDKASGEESKADEPKEEPKDESKAESDSGDEAGNKGEDKGQTENGTDDVKEDGEKADPDTKETDGAKPEGGSADKGSADKDTDKGNTDKNTGKDTDKENPDKGSTGKPNDTASGDEDSKKDAPAKEENTGKEDNGTGTKEEGKPEEGSPEKDDEDKAGKEDAGSADKGEPGKGDSADKIDGGGSKEEAADRTDGKDAGEASDKADDKPVKEESNDKADSDGAGSGSSGNDGGRSDGWERRPSLISMSKHQAVIVAIPADEVSDEDKKEPEEETAAENEAEKAAEEREKETAAIEETEEEEEEKTTAAEETKRTEEKGTSTVKETEEETGAEPKEETSASEESGEEAKAETEVQPKETTDAGTEKADEAGAEKEPEAETAVKETEETAGETTGKAEETSAEATEAEDVSKVEEAVKEAAGSEGSGQDVSGNSGNGSQEITDDWEIPGKAYDTVTIRETINARAYCVALEDVRRIVEANQGIEFIEDNLIGARTYTAETGDAEFTVNVPGGTFVEEVELRVTKIEDEEQLKTLANQAEEILEKGKTVSDIQAYDISFISLANGEEVEPAEAVSVNIRVKEPVDSAQAKKAEEKEVTGVSIVHMPDEGEAEIVVSAENAQETSFEFEAESFSTYALVRTANVEIVSKCVYLSSKGANLSENDPDIGLSPTKPVKTFEEAKSLLGDGEGQKIIYIVGQVDISAKDEVWEFLDSGYVLKRYLIDADVANGYRGTLIQITQGGSLTLSNIIIDGGGEEGNEDSASKGPIIKVDEGSKLVINEGAYLQNNHNIASDINNRWQNYKPENEGGIGGAIYNQGVVEIKDGIIQNNSAMTGGGIYTEGKIEIKGNGQILSNKARKKIGDEYYLREPGGCGGGIYIAPYASLMMDDETIISGNSAHSKGGGICIGIDGMQNIPDDSILLYSGTIESNMAPTGGGIYIKTGQKLTLSNVAINGNSAQYEGYSAQAGGGIWYCAYGNGYIYASSGGYISENTAFKQSDDIDMADEFTWWCPNFGLIAEDFHIATRLAGGQKVDWYKDVNNNRYREQDKHELVSGSPGWLTKLDEASLHSETESAVNIDDYSLKIINNVGNQGGGIACNGSLIIGEDKDIAITVTKKWLDLNGTEMTDSLPESIKVSLYRLEVGGEPQLLDSGIELNADNKWSHTFFDLPCGYQYRVVEENAGSGYDVSYYVKEEGETNNEEKVDDDYAVGDGTKKNWQITIKNQKILKKGDLVISKKIFDSENNLSERNKNTVFTFVIEFKNENQEILADGTKFNYVGGVIESAEDVTPPDDGILEVVQGKAEVKLKHGQKVTIKDILEGTQYTITEKKVDGDGYSVSVNGAIADSISGSITGVENETAEAAFTNVVKTGDLVISKQVLGKYLNDLDTSTEFTFKIELKDRDETALTGRYPCKKSDYEGYITEDYITNGSEITLQHGERIAIQGLPEGAKFTVWELKEGADGYTASIQENSNIQEAGTQEGMLVGGMGTIVENEGGAIHFINTVDTGSLSIQKTVTGLENRNDDEFTFEVKLTGKDDQPLTGSYSYTKGAVADEAAEPEVRELTLEEGKGTITLKDGQIVTIPDLPVGTKYAVEEMSHDGYTANSPVNASGIIQKKDIIVMVSYVNDADTGSLSIQKTVTGKAGDKDKGFNFTVTLTDKDGNPLAGTYPYVGSATETGVDVPQPGSLTLDANGEAKIPPLKHGQKITLSGLPAGTLYKVTEAEANQDGYFTKETGAEGTIEKDGEKTAAFVNDKPDVPEETTPEETTPEETPAEPTTPEETTPSEEPTTEPTTPEETSPSEEPTTEPTTPEETTPSESPENPTTPSRPSGGGGGGRDRDRNPSVTPETTPIPPEEVPLANIDPEDVPMAMMPSESPAEAMVIDDESVPLFGLPKTGDRGVPAGALIGMMLLSLMAACGIQMKKHKDEE